MLDPRFYETVWTPSAAGVAKEAGGKIVRGDPDGLVTGVAAVAQARGGQLTFLEGADVAAAQSEGVCLARPGLADKLSPNAVVIECHSPRDAFARIAGRMFAPREFDGGQTAIHPDTQIHPTAVLEPGCIIGAGVAVGSGARVGANAVIGPGVQIGRNTRIGARASIRCALLGDGVTILPGTVIGETGFGLAAGGSQAVLSPHFGRVIIQNGVSVGANTCIDRGLFEDTVLGEGTHIDNLCHIGHNCRIGSGVVMAAFAGVSGSVEIGDGVQFGGRVGVKDHIRIGAGARVAAGAAVLKDVPAGETHAGYPAKPAHTWMRELAWLASAAQKRPTKG